MTVLRFAAACITVLLVCAGAPRLAHAFTLNRTNNGAALFWDLTQNNAHVTGGEVVFTLHVDGSADVVDGSGKDLAVLRAAFAAWEAAPTSAIAFLDNGTTTLTTPGNDSVNLIIFLDAASFPFFATNPTAIAVTQTFFIPSSGLIIDSDIVFNDDNFGFSLCCSDPSDTDLTDDIIDLNGNGVLDNPPEVMAPAGDEVSLLAVALHEIGHFFGLDHSTLGYVGSRSTISPTLTSTIFPFYFAEEGESLERDDMVGASMTYTPTFTGLGSIAGTVVFDTGGNTFGAVVSALDATTGIPIVDILTNKNGTYTLPGLPPGDYVVQAASVTDAVSLNSLGTFYTCADTTVTAELYDNLPLTPALNFADAVPGMAPFDTATRVTVVADTQTPGIDLSVGGQKRTNCGGGGGGGGKTVQASSGGGGGGCTTVAGTQGAPWGGVAFVFALAVWVRLRRRRRPTAR